MTRNGPKSPTAVHGTLRIIYHPKEKANAIADCLENQLTSHDLRDQNHERQVETRVQALLASVDDNVSGKVKPCAIHKLANSLKLREAYGLGGIQNE
jgi:hypothetical protein